MAARFAQSDSDDEAWDEDDPDAPLAADLDDDRDEETPTVPCPRCRRQIPDVADRCPYCGDWVVQGGGTARRRRVWLVVIACLIIAAFLTWLLR